MKRYLVDTNALISFLTDRNESQQEKISKYFEAASDLKLEIIIIENVITELVYVLTGVYSIEKLKCNEIIKALIENPGIIFDNEFNLKNILSIWPESIKDYGDAILVSFAKKKKIKILTFDKNLQKGLKTLNVSYVKL